MREATKALGGNDMETIRNIIEAITTHWQAFIIAIGALLVGVGALIEGFIKIAELIPGEQPEKTLYKIRERLNGFITKVEKVSKK